MDRKTRDHFMRVTGDLPRQKKGHSLKCRAVGLRIVCTCQCGKMYVARFGNVAGYGYAVSYARDWYLRHTGQTP